MDADGDGGSNHLPDLKLIWVGVWRSRIYDMGGVTSHQSKWSQHVGNRTRFETNFW